MTRVRCGCRTCMPRDLPCPHEHGSDSAVASNCLFTAAGRRRGLPQDSSPPLPEDCGEDREAEDLVASSATDRPGATCSRARRGKRGDSGDCLGRGHPLSASDLSRGARRCLHGLPPQSLIEPWLSDDLCQPPGDSRAARRTRLRPACGCLARSNHDCSQWLCGDCFSELHRLQVGLFRGCGTLGLDRSGANTRGGGSRACFGAPILKTILQAAHVPPA